MFGSYQIDRTEYVEMKMKMNANESYSMDFRKFPNKIEESIEMANTKTISRKIACTAHTHAVRHPNDEFKKLRVQHIAWTRAARFSLLNMKRTEKKTAEKKFHA